MLNRFTLELTRLFIFVFLCFFLFISPSTWAENKAWQSTHYIMNSFVEIALNNEYSAEKSPLRKWQNSIIYTIKHRTADHALHQQITELHLQHLSRITGLSISPAQSGQTANLTIIFSSEKDLSLELSTDFPLQDKQHIAALSRHSVCLAHFSINENKSIKQAIVIIPVDRARAHAKLLSCVIEELTQIMGLPNDSDNVHPSIFNDHSVNDYLSGLDFLLLKLLYHPQLKVGMSQQQVLTELNTIIPSKPFQQLIQQSEHVVNQYGLYPLLN